MERTGRGQMWLEEWRCGYGDAKFAMRGQSYGRPVAGRAAR